MRKKCIIHKKTPRNVRRRRAHTLTRRYDLSTILLHYLITRMTLTLSYQSLNRAGDNQSR